MSAFKINEDEWNALHDEPVVLFKMYCAIRRCMNYDTQIAGLDTRISEQYFREVLSHSSRPGRKASEQITQKQIRWWVNCLERLGVVEHRGNYVFKCILASTDESNQKIKGVGRAQSRARGRAQENTAKPAEIQQNQEEVGREAGSDTSPRQGAPQESGNNTIINNSINNKRAHKFPEDFVVTESHQNFAAKNNLPSPESEFEKFKDYHIAKGSKFLDWNAAFRTWLRNAKQFNRGHTNGNFKNAPAYSKPRKLESLTERARREREDRRASAPKSNFLLDDYPSVIIEQNH